MTAKDKKVWFITRPERDPSFHKESLEALRDTTENFSLKLKLWPVFNSSLTQTKIIARAFNFNGLLRPKPRMLSSQVL